MIYFKGLGSRRPFHGGIGLRRARGFYLEWHPYWISFRFPVKLFLDILLDALSPPTEVTWFAEVIFAGQVFLLFVMGCLSVETGLILNLTASSNMLSTPCITRYTPLEHFGNCNRWKFGLFGKVGS